MLRGPPAAALVVIQFAPALPVGRRRGAMGSLMMALWPFAAGLAVAPAAIAACILLLGSKRAVANASAFAAAFALVDSAVAAVVLAGSGRVLRSLGLGGGRAGRHAVLTLGLLLLGVAVVSVLRRPP